MSYATDVSTTDEYRTHRLNEVAHRVDISGNISSISHQLLALSGIGLFMGTWAVVSYKKNKR